VATARLLLSIKGVSSLMSNVHAAALSRVQSLQEELLELQRADAERAAGVITLETDDPGSPAPEAVAVGYGLEEDGTYSLQLRVRAASGPIYEQAKELAEEASRQGYKTNLVVILEAATPTFDQIKKSKPHPRMLDPASPLHLGVSVGHQKGKPGSLGAFVSIDGKLGILSASHVLARSGLAKVGEDVHRPGLGDIRALGHRTKLGKLANYSIITDVVPNSVDAACALLNTDYAGIIPKSGHNVIPREFERCPIRGQKIDKLVDATEVLLGARVGKIGRTTGYTEGVITAVELHQITITNNAVLGTSIKFDNVIEVSWDLVEEAAKQEAVQTSIPFSGPGDSGSLVFTLDPPGALAIHIAGGKRTDGTGVSYACNLSVALEFLGCELASS
jgi:hypothetical protein